MDFLVEFVKQVSLTDLFDVALVALCLYHILVAIKRTRAVQIIHGVGVVLLLLLLAHAARLATLAWLLNWFLVSLAVLVPILFQPELRRALMRLGQQGMLTTSSISRMDKEELGWLIEELAHAASTLATVRHGALIVLEREIGLEDFVETGQRVDGLVSSKLLISIFHPKTPLHDGAVIIRGSHIVAAACYLNLSAQPMDDRFGTRHRAALGVSEQSDCTVLVVSEESGEVRIAHEGHLSKPMLEDGEIKKALNRYLLDGQPSASRPKFRIPVFGEWRP
ncbi:MAG: TIGR00159 family protein [Armatimonadetes bacterium]|nr:TIGR00159 family protein [Armatimonadota bacterium]